MNSELCISPTHQPYSYAFQADLTGADAASLQSSTPFAIRLPSLPLPQHASSNLSAVKQAHRTDVANSLDNHARRDEATFQAQQTNDSEETQAAWSAHLQQQVSSQPSPYRAPSAVPSVQAEGAGTNATDDTLEPRYQQQQHHVHKRASNTSDGLRNEAALRLVEISRDARFE